MEIILEEIVSYNSSLKDSTADVRNIFERNFDKIIFSSAFRRLQDKTQVFPLSSTSNNFVHNRLTHSLEVASVGRSLGDIFGNLVNSKCKLREPLRKFYAYDLKTLLSSSCLCHDIGNPPFGHSGENAISRFFQKNQNYISDLSLQEKSDLLNFEGNANSFRILSNHNDLKLHPLIVVTTIKYPNSSIEIQQENILHKKYGYFRSESSQFDFINQHFNLKSNRHPFVFLLEAADDICYSIIDIEDAHRIGVISYLDASQLLLNCFSVEKRLEVEGNLNRYLDNNEKISYIRAKLVNHFILGITGVLDENFSKILEGTLYKPLLDMDLNLKKNVDSLKSFANNNIYNNLNVLYLINAGYKGIFSLLEHFIPVILNIYDEKVYNRNVFELLPRVLRYKISQEKSNYNKIMYFLDYLSGMTDNYAFKFYQKINGIV